MYPNPANTVLTVELSSGRGQEAQFQDKTEYIYLYNSLGALVLTYKLTSNLTTIPVNNLTPGIYYYRIVDGEQHSIKADEVVIMR